MDLRIGARFRALRHRLGWLQADVARRASVSRSVVSLIERGRLERVSLAHLRAIASALDAEFYVQLRWRGGDLDRLMDEGHATLVGRVATLLRHLGWDVRLEVSYSVYGERGSIDVLAWHPLARVLLVVEVKTELVAVEETLRKHDQKARLAVRIAKEQLGWDARAVSRILVLPSLATPRRRVQRQAAVMDIAYPLRGSALRRWVASPSGSAAGLLFLDLGASRSPSAIARKRIRRRAA